MLYLGINVRLIIFGATGGTGQQLVKQALELGYLVTAFVRNPEKLNIKHDRLSIVKGDVLDKVSVMEAVKNHEVVLVALGTKPPSRQMVVGPGTQNIIAAMKKHGVLSIIVESAMFMDDVLRQKNFFIRLLVATFMKGLYKDKLVQEKAVIESGLDWVIVRPTMLTNGTKSSWRVRDPHEVGITSKISRANVADFMLKQIKDSTCLRRAILLSE